MASGLPAPPEGRVYQVWLKPTGLRTAAADADALFAPASDGTARRACPARCDGVEQVLVTDEPDGGSRQRRQARRSLTREPS